MLIAQVNRGFNAWSSWASCSLVFLMLIGTVVASAGYIGKGSGWKNWFFMKQKRTGSSVSLIARQIKPRKTHACVEVHVGSLLGGNSYFTILPRKQSLLWESCPPLDGVFLPWWWTDVIRKSLVVPDSAYHVLEQRLDKVVFFFQVLIIVDCMANPSFSLDGVTGCWLIKMQMWSVCHRWRCSSSLSKPFQFHPTVYERKANCIMTKHNIWKEMKDSDITVLWFLISIPAWEGKKIHAHNSFYQVFLGMITPSWVLGYFIFCHS